MALQIAEYLGQRTDIDNPINPVVVGDLPNCPFVEHSCEKVQKGNKPVCSVRRGETVWIVCEHRLCSSYGANALEISSHQKEILLQVAKEIFDPDIAPENVIYKKEVSLPIENTASTYKADFILSTHEWEIEGVAPKRVIVEMQGGGETSNTGIITDHITEWENQVRIEGQPNTNEFLRKEPVRIRNGKRSVPGIIQTNAWRRQQEQLLVKGHIATQTGYGIVLCAGELLYDYVESKLNSFVAFPNLRNARWDFALLRFKEKIVENPSSGHIPFIIDENKKLFTQFHAFSTALTTQGVPLPTAFIGNYRTLEGEDVEIR